MSVPTLTPTDRAPLGEPLRVAADSARLEAVRELAQREAERFGLDARGSFRFKLAASEAVANAIEHGVPDEDGTLQIWVSHDATRLIFRVRDGGDFAPRPANADALSDRGRGIPLMAALVDDVHIDLRAGATTVTLTQFRPGSGATA